LVSFADKAKPMRGGLCDVVEIVAIDADGAYRPRRAVKVYQLRAVENAPGVGAVESVPARLIGPGMPIRRHKTMP
jgi:hypothetical protein